MKKIIALALIVVLAACGPKPQPIPVAQQAPVEDRNPFFNEQAASAPAAVQQLPAPQAAQSDSGPGWGGVLAAGAIGYLLGNSSKPQPAPARPVVVYRDAPRPTYVPKPILPITPPRPNTVTTVQPPKPTVAPTTPYVVTQNTPKTTSVPVTPRTTTSTPYRSTYTPSVRPSFGRR